MTERRHQFRKKPQRNRSPSVLVCLHTASIPVSLDEEFVMSFTLLSQSRLEHGDLTFRSSYLPRGWPTRPVPSHQRTGFLLSWNDGQCSPPVQRGSSFGACMSRSERGGEDNLLGFRRWYVSTLRGGANGCLSRRELSTGTGVDSHVGVDFQHHVLVLVEEQDAEGRHLLWDAARLGNAWDHAHRPHYALDGGVIRGLEGLKQRGDYSTLAGLKRSARSV